MIRNVGVAVDGSDAARAAFEVAMRLSRSLSVPLRILTVVPVSVNVVGGSFGAPMAVVVPDEKLVRYHRELADQLKDEATRSGIRDVSTVVLDGFPVVVLMDHLATDPVDLLVVGARGLSASARLLLGSVSSALVSDAPCHVLVVRNIARKTGAPISRLVQRVVVAADGSPPSEVAFTLGVELAQSLKVPLRIVTVAPEGLGSTPAAASPAKAPSAPTLVTFEKLVGRLREQATSQGVSDVSAEVLRGHPVDAILTYLADVPSNLLVVGTRGLSPTRRLLLGSVSTALLQLTPSMVLVAKGAVTSSTKAKKK